ncbi:Lrp/AsnC family transcriptional regulator [Thalassotalea sp. PLHSN55]|uniref:Lrp/AsnC family transcriptional regulator n=1 Tax=Thalassotalea sp. PLHSN55 TaxID=3435888 RepID=UPI003F869BDE
MTIAEKQHNTALNTEQGYQLDSLDRNLINLLQHGLPVCENPFAQVAEEVNSSESIVIDKINNLLEQKILSRFGPMFDAACLGGAFTLAAIAVPEERFDEVNDIVNSFEQIAHNYKRTHEFNMWFVIATETEQEIAQVVNDIEAKTGLSVLNVPKEEEFYVGLYLPV